MRQISIKSYLYCALLGTSFLVTTNASASVVCQHKDLQFLYQNEASCKLTGGNIANEEEPVAKRNVTNASAAGFGLSKADERDPSPLSIPAVAGTVGFMGGAADGIIRGERMAKNKWIDQLASEMGVPREALANAEGIDALYARSFASGMDATSAFTGIAEGLGVGIASLAVGYGFDRKAICTVGNTSLLFPDKISCASAGASHRRQKDHLPKLGRGLAKAKERDLNPMTNVLINGTGVLSGGIVSGAHAQLNTPADANEIQRIGSETSGSEFEAELGAEEVAEGVSIGTSAAVGGAAALATIAVGYNLDSVLICQLPKSFVKVKSINDCKTINGNIVSGQLKSNYTGRGLTRAADRDKNPIVAGGASALIGIVTGAEATNAASKLDSINETRAIDTSVGSEADIRGDQIWDNVLNSAEGEAEEIAASGVTAGSVALGAGIGIAASAIGFNLDQTCIIDDKVFRVPGIKTCLEVNGQSLGPASKEQFNE